MSVTIIESYYINIEHTRAMARIEGDMRLLAYCPSDSTNSHWKIRMAQINGTLVGKTTPDAYVAPEPIHEPTEAELAEAELAARDAEGVDIRIIEDVIDALVAKTNVQLDDLPEAARSKLAERKALRATINGGA